MRTRLSLAHESINSWYSYNDTIEKIWVPVQKMKGNPCRSEVALNTSQNTPRAHWYPNHRISEHSEPVHVRSIFMDWCDSVVSSKSLALPMISEKNQNRVPGYFQRWCGMMGSVTPRESSKLLEPIDFPERGTAVGWVKSIITSRSPCCFLSSWCQVRSTVPASMGEIDQQTYYQKWGLVGTYNHPIIKQSFWDVLYDSVRKYATISKKYRL